MEIINLIKKLYRTLRSLSTSKYQISIKKACQFFNLPNLENGLFPPLDLEAQEFLIRDLDLPWAIIGLEWIIVGGQKLTDREN